MNEQFGFVYIKQQILSWCQLSVIVVLFWADTPQPHSTAPLHVVTPSSLPHREDKSSSMNNNIPVIVGVSITITVFLVIGIGIVIYRR